MKKYSLFCRTGALVLALTVAGLTGCVKTSTSTSASASASTSTAASTSSSIVQEQVVTASVPSGTSEVSDMAQKLYDDKLATTDDNTPQADLFKVLDLESYVGENTITVDNTTTPSSIVINVTKRPTDDSALQAAATIILALVDDAQSVQWSFPMSDDNPNVVMSASYTLDNANYRLSGTDVKTFSTSPEQVQILLDTLGYK